MTKKTEYGSAPNIFKITKTQQEVMRGKALKIISTFEKTSNYRSGILCTVNTQLIRSL